MNIVSSAAINMEVHISLQNSDFIFLDIYPEVELLGHNVVLFLIFEEPTYCFQILAVPLYIPTKSIQELPFLHILTSTLYVLSF